jgi:hypothetical protein
LNKYKDKNNGWNKESDVLVEDSKMNKHIFGLQRKTGLATEAGNTSIEALKTNIKQMVGVEEVDKIVQECMIKNTHHRQVRNSRW